MPEPDPPATSRGHGLISGVVGRVAPAVMRQIDMDVVVEQLDVNAIADRLDLDSLMQRLDMDVIVQRLDVNAIADRLDLDALMQRMDMAQLTAGATQDVALSGLDLARRQLMRADRVVDGLVGRLIRRESGVRPDAPAGLADAEDEPVDDANGSAEPGRRSVSGHYAGPVTRILALMADLSAAFTVFGLLGAVTLYLLNTLTGIELTVGSGGVWNQLLLATWVVAWFWLPVAFFGRTPAMALVGVAVVGRDGRIANGRRALVRALVLPFSVAILALGLVGMVLGRERRTLHDVVAGTVVVYDWGARQAEQPVTIRDQLSARVNRRRRDQTRRS